MYPNFNWLPWKFISTPQNYWKQIENQRKCLDYLTKELNIKEMDDWYKVSVNV